VSDLRDQTGAATITETFTAEAGQTLFEVALYSSALISATVNGVVDEQATALGELVTLWNPCAAGDEVVITYETQSEYAKAYSLGVRAAGGIVGGMSTAEGNNTTASAFSTHAEGGETTASGHYAHAEGYQTTASGMYSHAEGFQTNAEGQSSHVEGYFSDAAGAHAHSEGSQSHASGTGAHAEGRATRAEGDYSHSEGWNTNAYGNYSHAEGHLTHARGGDSHAEGANTRATNSYTHAEGQLTYATGEASHAEGISSRAEGRATHAQNLGTYAVGETQTAIGKYNATDNTSALIIGNGTADDARSNALTVDWSGNVSAAGAVSATDGTFTGALSADSATLANPLPAASGGTGKTTGLQWRSLGSFTGTNSLAINLSAYSEVMVAAKFNHTFNSQTSHKLVTAVVAKQLLTTTAQELWLGGGKSQGGTANSGALRAICNITTTKVTGVISSADSTDHTTGTTWYVYAR